YFSVVAPIIEAIDSGLIIGYTGDAAVAETLLKPYQIGNPALVESVKTFFWHGRFFCLSNRMMLKPLTWLHS
ncbi:PilT protein domain protein, partial [mine drainage metagenome]